jgi:hypothetical protein
MRPRSRAEPFRSNAATGNGDESRTTEPRFIARDERSCRKPTECGRSGAIVICMALSSGEIYRRQARDPARRQVSPATSFQYLYACHLPRFPNRLDPDHAPDHLETDADINQEP